MSTDGRPPEGNAEPSPEVLDELLKAFGATDGGEGIDLDDSAIDELLRLDEPAAEPEPAPEPEPKSKVEPKSKAEPAADPSPPAAGRKVIVIADDDRPDTEYLDDFESDRLRETAGDDRSTIVIGDVDQGVDAPYIDEIADRATMEPRMRARRVAVRRAAGRRRLRVAIILAGVAALLLLGLGLVASNAFSVTEIDVIGATYSDQSQLQAIVADIEGTPLLLLDERDVQRRVEEIAWVESARVSTDFPDRVVIDIRERTPLAHFTGADGGVRVIDIDGRVLDIIEGLPIAYVQITSPGPNTEVGRFSGAPYAVAAQYVKALPDDVRVVVQSMSIDPATGDLTMVLEGPVTVRLGDGTDITGKLVRLLQRVQDGLDGIVAIDVTTESPSVTPG